MIIIGISGHAESGKTTLVKNLQKKLIKYAPCIEVNFADPLRKLLLEYFIPEEFNLSIQDLQDQHIKNITLPQGYTIRKMLQILGTDLFRKIDPEIWVRLYISKIRKIEREHPNSYILTADIRFINELIAIHKLGGIVIRLMRKVSSFTHQSEKELDIIEYATKKNFKPKIKRFDLDAFFNSKRKKWIKYGAQQKFDFIIDNSNIQSHQTADIAFKFLKKGVISCSQ